MKNIRNDLRHLFCLLMLIVWVSNISLYQAVCDATQPRLATFVCDATPPLGQPMFSCDPLKTVEQPLLAKGAIVESDGQRYVLCAIDWCELCNGGYERFRRLIASAAETVPSRVALQAVHQHTAPLVDTDAQKLLAEAGAAELHLDLKVLEEIEHRLSEAVQKALLRLEPFNRVGVGQAKVDRVASSRRPVDAQGNICPRMSRCTDPVLRAMPEGTIDPYVKTITLAYDDKPLVRLHYYATHPQTFYGDNRASSDFVGTVREQIEQDEGVFQIYFTACGGDITVGKYNDGSKQSRQELTERLLAGVKTSIVATEYVPVGKLNWRTCPLLLPPRTDKGYSLEECLALVKDPKALPVRRLYSGAVRAAFHLRSTHPIEISCLQIGDVFLLHLPGEPVVYFQFYAQSLIPGAFVAVAGYGDCGPGYLCLEKMFSDKGGYEQTASTAVPESETLVKKAIANVLGVKVAP